MGIPDLRNIIFSQMATEASGALMISCLWWQYWKHDADFVLRETMILPIGSWGQIPEMSDAKR